MTRMVSSIFHAFKQADQSRSKDLDAVRGKAALAILAFAWLLGVVNAALTLVAPVETLQVIAISAAFPMVATVLVWKNPSLLRSRLTVSASVTLTWIVTVYCAGQITYTNFAIDAHLVFFVILGFVTALFCWRSVLLAVGITVTQHVSLAFLAPVYIWGTNSESFAHLVVHALVVVLATTASLAAVVTITRLFARSEVAMVEMQTKDAERNAAEQASRAQSEQLSSVVTQLADGLRQLGNGDLTYRLSDDFPQEHDMLRHDFNRALTSLEHQINDISATATELENNSENMSDTSNNLSNRTESSAATLEETAAALHELTSTVRTATESARTADGKAREASDKAEASKTVVGEAITAMAEIEKTSRKIAQIVNMIDDIAFQTNLLALNAGVEAARAGEAGRGFVVVASEVQALANRSSDAAQEINDIISSSLEQVDHGANLVQKAAGALTDIISEMRGIAEQVDGIAQSAEAQSSGIAEINAAVGELDQTMQQNSAITNETRQYGETLQAQAVRLKGIVASFQVADGDVLDATDQSHAA